MAKGSNGKRDRRGEKPSRATRQARLFSIIFLVFTAILILSMVLSLAINPY